MKGSDPHVRDRNATVPTRAGVLSIPCLVHALSRKRIEVSPPRSCSTNPRQMVCSERENQILSCTNVLKFRFFVTRTRTFVCSLGNATPCWLQVKSYQIHFISALPSVAILLVARSLAPGLV